VHLSAPRARHHLEKLGVESLLPTLRPSLVRWLLLAPTAGKSMLVSLVAHASLISASYVIWSAPVDHIAFTGQRNAIWIEATPAQPPQPTSTIAIVEPKETPEANELPVENLPEPNEPKPNEQSSDVERMPTWSDLVDIPLPMDAVATPHPRASTAESHRAPAAEPVLPHETNDPPQEIPRTEVSEFVASMLESQRQVAGIEEKQPPDFSSNRPPSYPPDAVRQRLEGTVILRLHISSRGVVERVEVAESSGHKLLDRAALDAVGQWRGLPASRGGRPVATVELLPIRFRL
jgi:protein TonB